VAGGAPGAGGAAAVGSDWAFSGLSLRGCWPSSWADSLRAWVTRLAGEKGWAADADATHPASGTAVAGSRGAAARPRPEAGRSL
jgi:hypothetical protein